MPVGPHCSTMISYCKLMADFCDRLLLQHAPNALSTETFEKWILISIPSTTAAAMFDRRITPKSCTKISYRIKPLHYNVIIAADFFK